MFYTYKRWKKDTLKESKKIINTKKKLDEYDLYIIPNLNNIFDLIFKIHVSIPHQGFLKMKI